MEFVAAIGFVMLAVARRVSKARSSVMGWPLCSISMQVGVQALSGWNSATFRKDP